MLVSIKRGNVAKDEEVIKGDIRAIRRELGEISLSLRIDTPWRRLQDHVGYAIQTLQQIPMETRLLCTAGVILIGIGAIKRNAKLVAGGIDLLMIAFVVVGEM